MGRRRHGIEDEAVGGPDAPALTLRAIGVIRSPFSGAEGTPIQPSYAAEVEGTVEVDPAYAAALRDLEGFERIWLIYAFDRAAPFTAEVVPYRDTIPHGLFATRAPSRPNPIGLSAVRLLGREAHVLRVAGVDVLDGTPLLDIKPYVPEFDAYPGARAGWFDTATAPRRVADDRFHRHDRGDRNQAAGSGEGEAFFAKSLA